MASKGRERDDKGSGPPDGFMPFSTNSVADWPVYSGPVEIPWPAVAFLGFLLLLSLAWVLRLKRRVREQQHRLRRLSLIETTLRARQRELLDTVSDLVFVLTRDGRFQEMNRAAEQAFGARFDNFAGVSIFGRIAPHDRPKLTRLLAGDGHDLGDGILELTVRDDQGFCHVIELTAWRPASRERGGGFYAVARDVTALKAPEAVEVDLDPDPDPDPEAGPRFPHRGSDGIWSRGE
jgi:PAS domain S-box-containing protein